MIYHIDNERGEQSRSDEMGDGYIVGMLFCPYIRNTAIANRSRVNGTAKRLRSYMYAMSVKILSNAAHNNRKISHLNVRNKVMKWSCSIGVLLVDFYVNNVTVYCSVSEILSLLQRVALKLRQHQYDI